MFVDASEIYGPGAVMAVDATEAEKQMQEQAEAAAQVFPLDD